MAATAHGALAAAALAPGRSGQAGLLLLLLLPVCCRGPAAAQDSVSECKGVRRTARSRALQQSPTGSGERTCCRRMAGRAGPACARALRRRAPPRQRGPGERARGGGPPHLAVGRQERRDVLAGRGRELGGHQFPRVEHNALVHEARLEHGHLRGARMLSGRVDRVGLG